MKSNKGVGVIYTVTHKESGKTYVGATTKSMQARKADHLIKVQRNVKSPFYDAIATYGADAFEWQQVDTASSMNELARKERQFIKETDAKISGFNGDCGGGFQKSIFCYNKNAKLVARYEDLETASKTVNVGSASISRACLNKCVTCRGFYWSYDPPELYKPRYDKRKKAVIQYTLSGKKVGVYDSVADASKATGVSKSCIAKVCRSERKASGGYLWDYLSQS